jgi:N-acetyl-gamma-glutamyl-phosphate reductase
MDIKTAIIGATGYTGSELVRLLVNHPAFKITALTSETKAGQSYSSLYPSFEGIIDQKLIRSSELNPEELDLLFLALPHGISMEYVRDFKDWNVKIVDLSGDFRLDSPETYEHWYGKKHRYPEGFEKVVYGLPELNSSAIKGANFVANPGCYPTASSLALLPLAATKALTEENQIIIDAKSGTTGAGVKASKTTHFSNVNDNFKAYALATHRHTIEIELILQAASKKMTTVQFTPHLLPVDRGILASCYISELAVTASDLRQLYKSFYETHPFIQIVDTPPSLKEVRGTNLCKIYPHYDERTGNVIIISVIDNLVKGAAGQAIHNANLMFNLEETLGLKLIPLNP